ncbi:HET-domain-containing protein [Acephala macrosclerotiorum]|nr:HET-domain-containing protein [Acephala macrosclerotiorum]
MDAAGTPYPSYAEHPQIRSSHTTNFLLHSLSDELFDFGTNSPSDSNQNLPPSSDDHTVVNLIYRPLRKEKDEIRLLHIHGRAKDNRIECTLYHTILHKDLQFTALSYVWGDPSETEEIIVNGKAVRVGRNLASGLEHIEATDATHILRAFWADGICINQNDIKERGHQVQLMGKLYSYATLVISWLGPESRNTTLALRLVPPVAKAIREAKDPLDVSWLSQFPEMWNYQAIRISGAIPPWREGLQDLAERPYWTRGWVFQETYLARHQVYMCGGSCVEAKDLEILSQFFEGLNPRYQKPDFIEDNVWAEMTNKLWANKTFHKVKNIRDSIQNMDKPPSLIDLVTFTYRLQVSNPRDKVYSLLGLTAQQIVGGYETPLGKVYSEFARFWLGESEDLLFLSWAGINTAREGQRTEHGIPSWAPDWQAISKSSRRALPFNWLYCRASRGYRGFPSRADTESGVLTWQGVELEVGKINNCISISSTEERCNFTCTYADKQNPPYPTGIPRLQALLRTMFHNTNPNDARARIDYNPEEFLRLGVDFIVESVYQPALAPEDALVGVVTGLYQLGFSGLFFGGEEFPQHFRERFLGNDSQLNLPVTVSLLDSFTKIHMSIYHVGGFWHTVPMSDYIFDTSAGYLGSGPPGVLADDTIWWLFGCPFLLVLRKVESHYVYIGPCFVLGFMDGEMDEKLDSGKLKDIISVINIH